MSSFQRTSVWYHPFSLLHSSFQFHWFLCFVILSIFVVWVYVTIISLWWQLRLLILCLSSCLICAFVAVIYFQVCFCSAIHILDKFHLYFHLVWTVFKLNLLLWVMYLLDACCLVSSILRFPSYLSVTSLWLIYLWTCFFMIPLFKESSLFYGLECHLSWWMSYVSLRRICILLLLDEIFYKCQLSQVDWWCCSVQWYFYWLSVCQFCQLLIEICWSLNSNSGHNSFCFCSVWFCFTYFMLCCWVYAH